MAANAQVFKPPRSLKVAIWRCRKRRYRQECFRWLRFGPTEKQLAEELEFETPDNLWQVTWRCRDTRYRKEFWRWLRYGPDEERDAVKFKRQWARAKAEGGEAAVGRYYLDQRARRYTSLTHHKSDVQTFYIILTAVLSYLAIAMSDRVLGYIGPSMKQVVVLLLFAVVAAMSSFTNSLVYPLITHFMGAAEYGEDVIHDESYINQVRQEINSLSRTLQRGRRRFSLSKLFIFLASAYPLHNYFFG